jgi:LysR family glycine cleavage system transcriptional activator
MRSRNVKSLPSGTVAHGIRRSELPPLHLLYTFEAAARTLSFTVAAGELFLTQSAVSRQIQQVEEALGAHLFERRHRALALTEAGQVMQRAVVDCLARLRDATASVRATQPGRQIAITTTPGFASLWLIPRLARFTASHPQVDVRISATLEVLDLQRSAIDVSVRLTTLDKGLGRPLFEEQVLPVCAPQLLQDRSKPLVRPADLAHHTLLAIDTPRGQSLTMDWEPWFKVMGLPEIRMKNTLRFSQYSMTYPHTQLFIDGQWQRRRRWQDAWPCSTPPPAPKSAAWPTPAAPTWTGAGRRAKRLRDLARPARHRTQQDHAPRRRADARTRRRHCALLTQEQGKPLAEAKGEAMAAADIIEWFADEGLRVYGRIVPSRFNLATRQMVLKDPVGPVAAFTPWNFPINQVVRKLAAALATGCSMIVKAPEETPASPAELIRAFADAGIPPGVLGLVYGNPAEISNLPDPAPGDPQDHLHRLHAGGQAAGGAGRPAHEARDDGTGRPRAGDRGRRRRRRAGREGRGRRQVPQRRAGVHLADALPGAREHPPTSPPRFVAARRA